MPFSISSKPEVLFGEGASLEIGERLVGLGCKKILCVYDQGVKSAGIVDPVVDEIKKKEIAVVHFDRVLPDPPDTLVNECGDLARKEAVDGVVGIGGGSSLDTAKAVNILLANPGTIDQYFGPGTPHNPSKPLILVPTTSGTGSEVTFVSVISYIRAGIKTGVAGPATIATLAVVDPLLTKAMPPHITASTGMDVFSHALEAWTSKVNNIMSDALAEKALELVITYLPRAVKDGTDMEARTRMSFASMIAGMSFNDAVPHLGHAFAHTLGALHHVPHGIGCAIAQPAVIDTAAEIMPDKVRHLACLMGLDPGTGLSAKEVGDQVAKAVVTFSRNLGIPTLKDLKIKESDLEKWAEAIMKDDVFFFVPKELTYEDVLAAVKKLYAS